ncbi:hypothetical protein MKX01_000126, partial [Papaver californicum]
MANKSWRNEKTNLRLLCDGSTTIAERKNKRPANQKKEDWEALVDVVSDDKDKTIRLRRKRARKEVKALHSTGRHGIVRRRHVMEQQSPTGSVSGSVVFLDTHVYQELPEEQPAQLGPDDYEARCKRYVGMVKDLQETEQYREETGFGCG